ncbi:restriction endonuclease subunit S [Pasteurella canis]|uniref:restriction endonuclease subunit S n=1 Tax=Pasteurella canis TaxID=753 RepID=UPI000D9929E5|nr:restriction endonuclease subunit S [Pasteurella canis]SPY34255.1 protein HsdA [Pasteurella canis]
MSSWKVCTVEELVKEGILEKPLDGNHGSIHPKSTDYTDDGIPFIMASDLVSGRVDLESCKFISKDMALSLRKGFAKEGDVLLSHKATIGRTALIQSNKFPSIVLTPQVTYYRVKNNKKLNNVYLKSYFDSYAFQSILNQWAGSGSTRAYIGITDQLKLPIVLPPYQEQEKIADILGSFDDKIQLNTQTNQTLEQIAQAIFKSWFVDFAPVKAKINALANGGTHADAERAAMQVISSKTDAELTQMQQTNPNAYKTLEKTAALFPSEMVESELGQVPKGWGYCKVGDVVDRLKNPQKLKKDDISEDYSVPVFEQGSNILMGYTQVAGFEADIENPMFIFGDHTCVTHLSTTPFSSYQNVITLKGFNLSTYWVYWAVRDKQKFQEYRRHWMEFIVKDIIVPDNKLLCDKFSERVKYFHKKIDENTKENQTLSEIRDSLLPRLLSGEFV